MPSYSYIHIFVLFFFRSFIHSRLQFLPSFYLSILLSFIHPSMHPSMNASMHTSMCMHACMHPSIRPFVHIIIDQSFIHSFLRSSVHQHKEKSVKLIPFLLQVPVVKTTRKTIRHNVKVVLSWNSSLMKVTDRHYPPCIRCLPDITKKK